MISAGDFKNGITLEIDGNVCQIVEFQHVKPGKGAAFVRTKYKNIITGAVLEKSFRPTEKFPAARIERVDMQYLYDDGDLYYLQKIRLEILLNSLKRTRWVRSVPTTEMYLLLSLLCS